jgi:hypothetical protein
MDYDHMLNGRGSRQHHQNIIREAQRHSLANEAKQHGSPQRKVSRIRAILIALITSLMG